jgi:hypothetical protein
MREVEPVGRGRLFPVVAFILLVPFYFYRGNSVTHTIGRQAIDFYPGQYARVVFNSEEPISGAMQAVHAAPNPTALNTAIAVLQKMILFMGKLQPLP